MRIFEYIVPKWETKWGTPIYTETVVRTTDEEILRAEWGQWSDERRSMYPNDLWYITEENCIKEWIAMFNAKEIND